MITVVFFITIITNLIIAFLNKNSKIITILSLLAVGIIMAGNTDNPDMIGYMNMFTSRTYSSTYEMGFKMLTTFVSRIGASYNQYLLVIVVLSFLLVFFSFKKYVSSWHLIIAGYMTYLMFFDITQIRYFIAGSFVLSGISFLAQKQRLFFVLLVLAGSLFHKSVLVFLIYFIIQPGKVFSKKQVEVFSGLIVILCILTFFNGNKIPYIENIVKLVLAENAKSVYFTTTTKLGFLYSYVCQFINIYYAGVANNTMQRYGNNQVYKDLCEVVFMITCVSCFALPLVMMNSNFTRFIRINNVLLLIIATLVIQKNRDRIKLVGISNKITTNFAAFYFLTIIQLSTWVFIKLDKDMVDMILNNNLFF